MTGKSKNINVADSTAGLIPNTIDDMIFYLSLSGDKRRFEASLAPIWTKDRDMFRTFQDKLRAHDEVLYKKHIKALQKHNAMSESKRRDKYLSFKKHLEYQLATNTLERRALSGLNGAEVDALSFDDLVKPESESEGERIGGFSVSKKKKDVDDIDAYSFEPSKYDDMTDNFSNYSSLSKGQKEFYSAYGKETNVPIRVMQDFTMTQSQPLTFESKGLGAKIEQRYDYVNICDANKLNENALAVSLRASIAMAQACPNMQPPLVLKNGNPEQERLFLSVAKAMEAEGLITIPVLSQKENKRYKETGEMPERYAKNKPEILQLEGQEAKGDPILQVGGQEMEYEGNLVKLAEKNERECEEEEEGSLLERLTTAGDMTTAERRECAKNLVKLAEKNERECEEEDSLLERLTTVGDMTTAERRECAKNLDKLGEKAFRHPLADEDNNEKNVLFDLFAPELANAETREYAKNLDKLDEKAFKAPSVSEEDDLVGGLVMSKDRSVELLSGEINSKRPLSSESPPKPKSNAPKFK